MNQPGMVVSPTRGQLNGENYVFLYLRSRLRIWSRLFIRNTSTESGAYSRRFSRLPRRRLIYYTVEVGPEFVRSRNCVQMMFTAESTAAQGQYLVVVKVFRVMGAAYLGNPMDQLRCIIFFPRSLGLQQQWRRCMSFFPSLVLCRTTDKIGLFPGVFWTKLGISVFTCGKVF